MMERRLLEEDIGAKIVGNSRTITSTELDLYCSIVGLRLDAFLKDDAAIGMGFKGRVVPGPFLFGLVFGLLGNRLDGLIHIGTEKLKVMAPLYPYDVVRVEVEIKGKKDSSDGTKGFLTWAWALKNQNDLILIQGENT